MDDTKIYLICDWFPIYKDGWPTGKKEYTVSHGVGNNTLRNYCLPCEHPDYFKPKRDTKGLYIDAYE